MQLQIPHLLSQLGSFSPPVQNEWTKNVTTPTGSLTTMELVISDVIGILTVVGGILFLYSFLQGSLSWVTAGGDSGKIQKARDQMIQGVIGLIVIVAAYAIIGLVGTIVGVNILNPAQMIFKVLPTATP